MLCSESLESRLWRWGGNLFPAYRRTGARVTYVSPDFHDVHVKIPSNWQTRNHMGITWGGGLYSALDPIYGVMLFKILAYRHRVIDKHAEIHFIRPGKTTLYAEFVIDSEDVAQIKKALRLGKKVERIYEVDLLDRKGLIHASCRKQLCVFPDKQIG